MMKPFRSSTGISNDGRKIPGETGSRHPMSYHTLLQAFTADGCPICALVEEESTRHLHALYYEFVNDAGVRDALHRSRGFCNWHAWSSTEIPCTNTGIAIIYRDLLEAEIAMLRKIRHLLTLPHTPFLPFKTRKQKKILARFIQDWRRKEACIVCKATAAGTLFHLREFLDYLGEEAFVQRFKDSMGLCLPHLKTLVETLPDHPNLSTALEIQLDKYQHLSWELGEFWRKHDYRFQNEPRGNESDSWLRVTRLFVGLRGHYGNDLHLTHPSPVHLTLWSRVRRKISSLRVPSLRTHEDHSPVGRSDNARVTTTELKRVLKQEGCPICRIGSEASKSYFAGLLKQTHDDLDDWASRRKAGEFCASHAAWFHSNGPEDVKTIIVENLVSDALGKIDAFLQAAGTGKALHRNQHRKETADILAAKGACPACMAVKHAEDAAIKQLVTLLSGPTDGEGKRQFKDSDGLCMKHLNRAIQIASSDTAIFLAKDMQERLAALSLRLRVSKSETRKKKKNTWREGLIRLTGQVVPVDES